MKNKLYVFIIVLLLSITVSNVCLADSAPVDLNFVDEDVRVVLHTLATVCNVDMIIDDSIKGTITLKLNNASFDTAMELITSAKNLSYRKIGDAVVIEPAGIDQTEKVQLRYTQASNIKKTLAPMITGLKLTIETDDISNSLVLSGSPVGIDRVKKMITDLDRPSQQVVVEAQVVAINKSNAKDLGIDWSWDPGPQTAEHEEPQINVVNGTTIITPGKVTRDLTKGVIEFGRGPEGYPYQFYYQAKISALVSNGNAKILAKPKVMTINGKEARILIGDRIPVLTESISDGKTTTTISYIETGIKLTYTPSINDDGIISAKVHTEVSTPILVPEIKNYRITTREAESNVRMKDGETMVIGGLIGSEDSKTMSKIPFLGDLPLLGRLFSSVHNTKNETEVIIFLTAHVVK